MPKLQFLDVPSGDPISYVTVTADGYRLCPFMPIDEAVQKNFDDIPNKKYRDDDIMLISYPKTGTNWLWEMVTMVVTKSPQVTGGNKGMSMIEAMPTHALEALPSPRILNSHVKYKYIPKEVLQKKLKTVLLCRNPKDAAVSFYNHTKGISMYEYDGKFDNYLAMYMRGEVDYGSYPEYLLEWQQAIRDNPDWPIHVMYYEDLKKWMDELNALKGASMKDCFQEMRKVCDYLDQDIEDDLLREITDNCQIDKMRKGKAEKVSEEMKKHIAKVSKNNFSMMRKGQVGDWKNWFTVAQSEMFDKWWADNTKELDMFNFRYTL